MATINTRYVRSLERWGPTLFLLAGAVLFLLLVVGRVVRFTAVSIPRTAYWPLLPLAVALSLGGVVGLYPRLAERARWSAIIGGGFGLVGGIALIGGLGALLVASPPGPYPGNLGVLGAPFFLGLLAFVPAVGLYGLSGLRTGLLSRRIGGLLVLVGFLQFGELIGAEVLFSSAGTAAPSDFYVLFEIAVYGVIATAMVTIGYSLRHDATLTEREDTVSDPEIQTESSDSEPLETWSSILFLVGGLLVVGHAAMMGVQAFTGMATPPDVFAPAGHLLVFGGLVGVYFTLVDRAPILARIGGICVVLGTVGFTAITAGNLATLVGIETPSWFAMFTVLAIIGMIPGFLAFGVASLRTDVHSRTVGLLLLAPAALFLVLIVEVLVLGASAIGGLIIGSGLALTHLAIGYSLRTGTSPTDNAPPAGDVTAS